MLDPITPLTALAYAVVKYAGATPGGPNPVRDVFAQMFSGAAGNAFNGDVQGLKNAFLNVSRPDSNQDLERASARSALHADLFCLMESLGESLEPPSGQLEKWRLCVQDRLPQALKDIHRPYGGFLSEANRSQLLQAKADCVDQLKKIEISFKPNEVKPHHMLAAMEGRYAEKCAADALAAIEIRRGIFPPEVHRVFLEKWFGYLCNSFHYEIKQNQPVASILLNISMAELDRKLDQGFGMVNRRFDEMQELIRERIKPVLRSLIPFATLPPAPDPFIARPEITEPIIENLLARSGTVGLTAIDGMGGVGKTVAALSLCYDRRIREAFPDGIIWLSIGKEANISLERRIERIAIALNQEFREYSEATYRTLLSDKAILVVLDDVWEADDVEPFLLGSGRSRLLYTSRDKGLAGSLHAKNFEVGVIDGPLSRHFLARWSDRNSNVLPEPAATGVLNECGGLALGLAMIGAALKAQPDQEWANLLADLKRARLKDVGLKPRGYGYQTLYASIAVSVDALPSSSKSRYLQLAVLLEDMPAAKELLRALWGEEDREVERTMRLLVDRSLATRDSNGNIRLHDFQLDYIRGEYPDPQALALIRAAVRLSADILETRPDQFTPQLVGRLLPYQENVGVGRFTARLAAATHEPWLRPLKPALTAPGASLVRKLTVDRPHSVIGNSDGSRALTANSDGTVVLWDLNTGRKLGAFGELSTKEFGPAVTARVSADFKTAVFRTEPVGALRVCSLETKEELKSLPVNPNGIRDFVISPDGKVVILGGRGLTVWDLDAGQEIIAADSVSLESLQVCANWKTLLINSGGIAHILDIAQWRHICQFDADLGYNGRIAISSDGRRAVSHSNKILKVWDLETGVELHKCKVAADFGADFLVVNADGTRAISAERFDRQGRIRIWDLDQGQEIYSTIAHSGGIVKLAISSDGERAVSAGANRTLKLFDLDARSELQTLSGHSGYILDFDWNEKRNAVLSVSTDSTLAVWTLGDGQPPTASVDHTINVSGVASSSDGRRVVSAAGFWDSDIGELKVWDGETLSLIRTIECHPVAKVAITADGRQAISASFDHTLKVWDLDSGLCRGTLAGHRDQVEDVAVSGDGARALSVSADGTVRVWDTKRLRDLYTLVVARREEGEEEGEEGEEESTGGFALRTAGDEKEKKWERVAGCVALTGGDKRAVVGFHDGTLELLDFDTGAILGTLVGHKEGVEAVASTVDGGRAVSASDDGILKLWNLNTGLELRTLVRQPDYFHAVAVSRDGRRAASASDRNLKLWDLDKGELINEYICDGEVTSCAFLDESRIVAGDAGGRVHFFRLEENQSTVY